MQTTLTCKAVGITEHHACKQKRVKVSYMKVGEFVQTNEQGPEDHPQLDRVWYTRLAWRMTTWNPCLDFET
jgi:hypothetical protein